MKRKNIADYLKYVFLMLAVPVMIQVLPVVSAAEDSENAAEVSANVSDVSEDISDKSEDMSDSSDNIKSQTIMIYMIGADLESFSGCATKDLKEMMDADINTETSNVLVYTGGSNEWKNNVVSSEYNSLFSIQHGGITEIARTENAVNMGEASTLADFINYSIENYPAESYSLILWDHGGGPLLGYGSDEKYSGDGLELKEISLALEGAGFGGDKKLEVIGFDACLMGSIEVAYELSDFADYMIASEETEIGEGWDYEFLSEITNNICDGEKIGKAVINNYQASIESRKRSVNATLSCIDLSYMETADNQLGLLFRRAVNDIDTATYPQFARERSAVRAFGKSDQSDPGNFYDVVDLIDLVEQLSAEYPEEAETLLATLAAMISVSYSNMENANGLSIYYPYENTSIMAAACVYYANLGFCQPYNEYINAFADILMNGEGTDWNISSESPDYAADEELVHLSFQLTEEQMAEYDSARFYILVNSEEYNDTYVDIHTAKKNNDDIKVVLYYSNDVSIDENGLLQTDYDGRWFTINGTGDNGSDAGMGILPKLISKEDGLEQYSFSAMLIGYPDRNSSYGFEEYKSCDIFFTFDTETGIATIDGCRIEEDDDGESELDLSMSSKGLITIDELKQKYQYLIASTSEFVITRDESGNILTTDQWGATSSMYMTEILLEDEIKVNAEKLDQLDSLTCIFCITDIHQRKYMSDYIDIPLSFSKSEKEMLKESLDYLSLASETFGIKEEVLYRYHFNKDEDGNWMFRYNYTDGSDKTTEIKIVPFENLTDAAVETDYILLSLEDDEAIRKVYFSYNLGSGAGYSDETDQDLLLKYANEKKELEMSWYPDYEYSDMMFIEENGRKYVFWLETRKSEGDYDEDDVNDYVTYSSKVQICSLQDTGKISNVYLYMYVSWSESTESENFGSEEAAEKIVREIVSHIN